MYWSSCLSISVLTPHPPIYTNFLFLLGCGFPALARPLKQASSWEFGAGPRKNVCVIAWRIKIYDNNISETLQNSVLELKVTFSYNPQVKHSQLAPFIVFRVFTLRDIFKWCFFSGKKYHIFGQPKCRSPLSFTVSNSCNSNLTMEG